jgi:hypothetical protein
MKLPLVTTIPKHLHKPDKKKAACADHRAEKKEFGGLGKAESILTSSLDESEWLHLSPFSPGK